MVNVITRRNTAVIGAAGALIAALAMAPSAHAATYYACVKKNGGSIRIVSRTTKCRRSERKISFNSQGVPGVPGRNGTNGRSGPTGATGGQGQQGSQGPAGPFPGVLPRGITLRGNYNIRVTASGAGQFWANSVSFGFAFASAPEVTYVSSGSPTTGPCAGGSVEAPRATAGHICFFSETSQNQTSPGAFMEATPFGAKVELMSAAAGDAYDFGTWAATSP
jgi:hypothetical protein